MNKDKGVVSFGAEPDYANRIASAKTGAPPIGGAPMPAIPRLDQPPPGAGDRFTSVQRPSTSGIPNTLLTQEQKEALEREGKFIPGVGSGFAANQPGLKDVQTKSADGERVVNPPRAEGGLRPETVQQLEGLAKATEVQENPKDTEVETLPPPLKDELDFEDFGQRMRSLLNNRKRIEAIEKRITDQISIEDLIIHQEIRQRVPIVPGRFVPTFRSPSGHEDLWVKRQMGSETGSDTYITDRYAMLNLCCGLYALNSTVLPSHLSKDGYVDEKAFDAKYAMLLKYPLQILADLSVNYVWFLRRADRALVVDDIKVF